MSVIFRLLLGTCRINNGTGRSVRRVYEDGAPCTPDPSGSSNDPFPPSALATARNPATTGDTGL